MKEDLKIPEERQLKFYVVKNQRNIMPLLFYAKLITVHITYMVFQFVKANWCFRI